MNGRIGELRLHDQVSGQLLQIGAEGSPLLVIDNFVSDPQALIELAVADDEAYSPELDSYYPGLRATLPGFYAEAVHALIGDIIGDAFGFGAARPAGARAYFSVMTTRPEALAPLQRVPHFDSFWPNELAVLHYLSPVEQGGTSFYRHRATGYENVLPDRAFLLKNVVAQELEASPPPAAYIGGDTDRYERIATVGGVFNRCVIYRGMLLHSPEVPHDFRFDPSPRTGRLTANLFLRYPSNAASAAA